MVVQSFHEIDVRFRRLTTYFRKYYPFLRVVRRWVDLVFRDVDTMDETTAEINQMGFFINLHPIGIKYPNFDYDTTEVIIPGRTSTGIDPDIYVKGTLIKFLLKNHSIKK